MVRQSIRPNAAMGQVAVWLGLVGGPLGCSTPPAPASAVSGSDTATVPDAGATRAEGDVNPPIDAADAAAPDVTGADTGDQGIAVQDSAVADTAAADSAAADSAAADTAAADTAAADSAAADSAGPEASIDSVDEADGGGAELVQDTGIDGGVDAATDAASAAETTAVDAKADSSDGSGSKDSSFGFDAGTEVKTVPPCSPALAVVPAKKKVLPFGLVALKATGGTGQYKFALTTNASDGLVNQYTGAYLAGDVTLVTDVVTLTDLGCTGTATAELNVLQPMLVATEAASVPPGGKLKIAPLKGSGSFAYSLSLAASGGSVSGGSIGVYTAGAKAGLDVIVIADTKTGQVADITVTVVAGSVLQPNPERWAIPLGSTVKLGWSGGSSVIKATSSAGTVKVDGTVLHALSIGAATVTLTDTMTEQTAQVQVSVIAPLMPNLPRTGDYFEIAQAVAVTNVKSGLTDLALGWPEADITHFNDGAVFVYPGAAAGLAAEAAQVLHGVGQEERFGYAVVAANFDKAGGDDLAVGAPLADAGAGDAGQVLLFTQNTKTGLFKETPFRALIGPFGNDQFGTALAVCDFNADGWLDLAVGAPFGEDRDLVPQQQDQGAVHLFLGHEGGFVDKAEQKLYGALPDGGVWKDKNGLRIGQSLAAGDVNGDGACDLAVYAGNYSQPGSSAANDGAVFVYKGIKASAQTQGGLADQPALAWAPQDVADAGSSFGRWLAMGDLTGDGKAELAITHRGHDNILLKPVTSNVGAVRVFKGVALPNQPTAALGDCMDADWSVVGPKASDAYGGGVAIADVDGDAIKDLLVGHALGELPATATAPASANDGGVLAIYAGKSGAMPAKTADWTWAGAVGGDRFGLFATVLPKADTSGKSSLVAVAPSANDQGAGVGQVYVYAGAGTTAVKLAMPGAASGHRYGAAVAIVGDLDGDGFADLVAGAPNLDDPKGGEATTGNFWMFGGGQAGFEAKTSFEWLDYLGHNASDGAGYAIASAGDFDGDGKADFAVVARNEDVPTTFSASYVALPASVSCIADPAKPKSFKASNDIGAVFVFSGADAAQKNPRWVTYGVQASQSLDTVAGGFDFNGDGLDDLLAGSLAADQVGRINCGAALLTYGRKPSSTAGIAVQCPDLVLWGPIANDNLGRSVAGLGDIDGDGCDEVAIGISGADQPGKVDQGAVAVVFGFGAKCKHSVAKAVVLYANEASAQAGFSLGAGDLDGDALPDLVVGAVGHLKSGNSVGAAWVVLGSYLAKQTPEPWADGELALTKPALLDPNGGVLAVEGEVVGERAGTAVAIIPRPAGKGFAGIIVGSPLGAISGTPFSGGVRVFRFKATGANAGLQANTAYALAGESSPSLGRVGDFLQIGVVAGKPWLVVGAPLGTPHLGINGAPAVDIGTVYAVNLSGLVP
ncbi:MAG: hypothetical protein EXR77_01165 [Myxococcales bacterium]|nr:hypothetical protein [Myxococcales bacterium]